MNKPYKEVEHTCIERAESMSRYVYNTMMYVRVLTEVTVSKCRINAFTSVLEFLLQYFDGIDIVST
jgi:hypothetical protein